MTRPIAQQVSEVERELALRRSVYPGLVGRGKMRQAEADEHMARMEAVLATLRHVAAKIAEREVAAP
jgi:hypothetical protein